MKKDETFGLAGIFLFLGLWLTLAAVPQYPSQPYVHLTGIGLGVFVGAIGFYLIGHAIYGGQEGEF